MSDFDFRQFEQFAERWQRNVNQFDPFLKKFLLEMAMRVIAKVKPRTPVDTGALRAMWGVGSQLLVVKSSQRWDENSGTYKDMVSTDANLSTVATVDMVSGGFEIAIWNGMDYASFIEYGSRIVGGAWRDGVFMLTVSMDEVNQQMPARFHRDFKRWLIERGMA